MTEDSNIHNEQDKIDTITMDVPLFIRILEFAKEDAKTDMDLHTTAEKCIALSKEHNLTMADYDHLVPQDERIDNKEVSAVKESIVRLGKNKV